MDLEITHCCRSRPEGDIGTYIRTYLQDAASRFTLTEGAPVDVPERGLVWIQGNAAWYPEFRRRLISLPAERRPTVLIWHTEPLPPPRAARLSYPKLSVREIAKIILRDSRATDVYTNYLTLRQLNRAGLPDILVVSAAGRKLFLAERGINSHFVPFGYDPRMGRDLGLEKDIDVLFLGALNVPRRNRILKSLRNQGINITALGDWSNPAYWGEQRTLLLNRVKILLNFPRTPAEYSGARILLGLANKALVISEPIHDPAPYVPGKHFVMAPIEELPQWIRHYLSSEAERARIVEEGHQFALTELTMERSVSRILQVAAHCERSPNGGRFAEAAVDSRRPELRS
jgi:hypothetical protein